MSLIPGGYEYFITTGSAGAPSNWAQYRANSNVDISGNHAFNATMYETYDSVNSNGLQLKTATLDGYVGASPAINFLTLDTVNSVYDLTNINTAYIKTLSNEAFYQSNAVVGTTGFQLYNSATNTTLISDGVNLGGSNNATSNAYVLASFTGSNFHLSNIGTFNGFVSKNLIEYWGTPFGDYSTVGVPGWLQILTLPITNSNLLQCSSIDFHFPPLAVSADNGASNFVWSGGVGVIGDNMGVSPLSFKNYRGFSSFQFLSPDIAYNTVVEPTLCLVQGIDYDVSTTSFHCFVISYSQNAHYYIMNGGSNVWARGILI